MSETDRYRIKFGKLSATVTTAKRYFLLGKLDVMLISNSNFIPAHSPLPAGPDDRRRQVPEDVPPRRRVLQVHQHLRRGGGEAAAHEQEGSV